MDTLAPRMTLIGGPTVLLEWGGLRLLTDPTFDPAGSEYAGATYTLRKMLGPAVTPESLGAVDVVLLSHDHHSDNLDRSGRALLGRAGRVLTTTEGAARLGGSAVGLAPWESAELQLPDGGGLRVTATPARHGPAHLDRGPVIGFALEHSRLPGETIYLSGDTVWFDGVRALSERFRVRVAVLFMGAARVRAVGDWPLTFTGAEGVTAARSFAGAAIVPVHYEGWEHFSESRADIERAFRAAGLEQRLLWLEPGRATGVFRRTAVAKTR